MKKFEYIPSFSGGFFGELLKSNHKIGGKIPVRFYDDDYPVEYKHNSFLVTAGHNYKNMNCSAEYGFDLSNTNNLIFGDSGGYQIATGAIKWDVSIRDKIFNWLEHNSNIAVNLDIPPRVTWAGRDSEALEISIDNFKYFEKHQSGKTKYLNVLQGNSLEQRKVWYNKIKDFNFQGWAIGGSGGSYVNFIDSIYILIKNKEHLNERNHLIHFLGASSINEFLFYLQLQKSLNDIKSPVTITTDSSTPQRAVIWGTYYTEFNISNGVFYNITFPNIKHQETVLTNLNNSSWPIFCNFDKILTSCYDWKEYVKNPLQIGNQQYMAAMTLHNFSIFKDAIEKLDMVINQDDYFKKEIFNKDIYKILIAIDELVKSSDPEYIYNKYRPLFSQYENNYGSKQIKKHNYF